MAVGGMGMITTANYDVSSQAASASMFGRGLLSSNFLAVLLVNN
jgi:hypothetical protein